MGPINRYLICKWKFNTKNKLKKGDFNNYQLRKLRKRNQQNNKNKKDLNSKEKSK